MSPAVGFLSPWLLLGLLAAIIPLALHLLAKSRAQEAQFPTLIFLKLSMHRTSRRRRIQHLGLMALRMLLLALLAVAVAEPFSRPAGGWTPRQGAAAVLVLDNSLSMAAAGKDEATSFARAKTQALALLNLEKEVRPAKAAVVAAVPFDDDEAQLTDRLDLLRARIEKLPLAHRGASAGRILSEAADLLADPLAQRTVYLFTDLQRASFENIDQMRLAAGGAGLSLMIIDAGNANVTNVGVSGVSVQGKCIVDHQVEVTANLKNYSPMEKTVEVSLLVNGVLASGPVAATLAPAGGEGSQANCKFGYSFTQEGPANIEVAIETPDDLMEDNSRRLALNIGGRVEALVVGDGGDGKQPLMEAAAVVGIALEPLGEDAPRWHINAGKVESAAISPQALAGKDIVFLCDVPSVAPAQAQALRDYVQAGGWAVFFLGPRVDVENYNAALGAILPAVIGPAVGEIGFSAEGQSVAAVDVRHGFFKDLFPNESDYLGVVVQRYYPLTPSAQARGLVHLKNSQPLIVEGVAGGGKVVLVATDASPLWSSLPKSGLFLPMVLRMSLLARQGGDGSNVDHICGSQVRIVPGFADSRAPEVDVVVDMPGAGRQTVKARASNEGMSAVFSQTADVGFYQWQARNGDVEAAGCFAVNPDAREGDLERVSQDRIREMLSASGFEHVHIGQSVQDVHSQAAIAAEPRNWWGLLSTIAVVVLVLETLVANMFRKPEGDFPR
jgi:hypothetical protein